MIADAHFDWLMSHTHTFGQVIVGWLLLSVAVTCAWSILAEVRNRLGAWVDGNPRGTGDDVSVVAEAERLLEKEARRG